MCAIYMLEKLGVKRKKMFGFMRYYYLFENHLTGHNDRTLAEACKQVDKKRIEKLGEAHPTSFEAWEVLIEEAFERWRVQGERKAPELLSRAGLEGYDGPTLGDNDILCLKRADTLEEFDI